MKMFSPSYESFAQKRLSNRKSRSLHFEPLEERQLLAVSYQIYTNEQCTVPGLTGSYVNANLQNYSNQDDWRVTQTIAGSRVDNPPNFTGDDWGNRSALNLTGGTNTDWDYFSVQWDGYIKITQPTALATWSDDGSRMWIDVNQDGEFDSTGQEFVNNGWGGGQGATVGDSSVVLREGTYKIRMQYYEIAGGNLFALREMTPNLGMSGIAVDSKGNIINVESKTNVVSVYDSTGKLKFYFGSAGNGNGQFNGPRDVAVDKNDNIYVADTGNHRIQVFDSAGRFLRSFDASNTSAGKLSRPEGITYDAKTDKIYVTDTGNHRVLRLGITGTLDTTFGKSGVVGIKGTVKRDHTGFDTPTAVAVHPTTGNVYIADKINSRIEVYDAKGTYVRSYLSVFQPDDMEFLANGDLLIVGDDVMPGRKDYINDAFSGRLRVLRYGSEFTTAMYYGGVDDLGDKTSGVAVKKDGSIVIADEDNSRLAVTKIKIDATKAFPDDLSFVEPITDIDIETYGNRVVITWKTANPSSSYLEWGSDKNNMTGSVSDTKLKTSHSLTITGLDPQSLLYYQIGFNDSFNGSKVRWTVPDKINSGVPDGEKLVLRLKTVGLVWADKDDKAGSISRASDEEIEMIKQLYRDLAVFVWQNSGFNVWIDFVAMPVYTGDFIRDGNPKSTEDILKEFGFSVADDLDIVLDTSICWGGAGGGVGGSGGMFDRGIGWSYQEWDDGRTIVHEVNHIFDFAVYGWHDIGKYEAIHPIWSIMDAVGGDRSCNAQVYDNLYTANYTATGGDFAKWLVVADKDRDGLPDDSPTNQGLVTPFPITEKTLGSSPTKKDTDGDGISDFDEARYFPYNGIDPTATDTDGDGARDNQDLNPGYPIGDNVKKNAPELDGVILENDGWTIITDYWGYDNSFGAWDNNEHAQNVVTAMSWDEEYMYFAIEYQGWQNVDVYIDGGCDNWYYGLDTYALRLHAWNSSPDVTVFSGLQDMHMQMGAEYGDLYADNSDRFNKPYNGRPIADNAGDGFGITERLVNSDGIIFVKKHNSANDTYTWELAIPWSPNVTGLVGYDQKIIGIDISVGGDKLFNTDTYAFIKFVGDQEKKLAVTSDKTSAEEGLQDAVAFTVTRTGDVSQALVLTVKSNDTGELTVPQTVTIPAGQKSVTFYGTTIDDKIRDGAQTVTVTVSATDFESVSTEITVLDVASSEIVLESPALTQTAMQGSSIDVSWIMKNIGTAATAGQWTEKIYVSKDDTIANGTQVYSSGSSTAIESGTQQNRSATITLPNVFSDQCRVIIELTWEGRTVMLVSDPIRIQRYTLALTTDKSSVTEGIEKAVTFTVTRTGNLQDELVMQITADKSGELDMPETVTLPAGQASVTFTADSLQDYVKDGDRQVRVSLAIDGETAVSTFITVLDVPPAELVVDSCSVPSLVLPNETFDISWVVKNIGKLDTNKSWVENVYLSKDNVAGDDLPVLLTNQDGTLTPNQTVERTQSVTLPDDMVDNFWIVFEIVYEGETYQFVSDMITVFNTTLTLTSNSNSAAEGENNAFTFTVTRAGNTDSAQVINIVSDNVGELTVPKSVTIPAGQTSITFVGTTIQDNVRDGNQRVTVTVSIESPVFVTASTQVTVIDVVPADLQISELVVPLNAYTGSEIDISWLLTNIGEFPRTQAWTERILLSTDNQVGGDVTLLSRTVNERLESGLSMPRSAKVILPPETTGNHYIIVQTVFEDKTRSLVSDVFTIVEPNLSLSANVKEIEEGIKDGILFTVIRAGDLTRQIEVTISSSNPDKLTVPSRIVIPAGERFGFFRGSSVQDNVVDGNQRVTVSISAGEYGNGSIEILVIDTSVQSSVETLPMSNLDVNHWTVRREGDLLFVRNATQQVVFEKPLSQLLGLVVNASDSYDDTLTVDLSGGKIELEQGIKFNGNEQNVNVLNLLGTENDDIFEFRNAAAVVNGLDVTWQQVRRINVDGDSGFDKAQIFGPETNGAYFMSDDHFVMQADGRHIEVNRFNRINAFAGGNRDKTLVYGRNNSLIIMNDQYVEHHDDDQTYRVWRSEQVVAINMDDTNNAILHNGSRAFDRYMLVENYGSATNANGSYFHEWIDFETVDILSQIVVDRQIVPQMEPTLPTKLFETNEQIAMPVVAKNEMQNVHLPQEGNLFYAWLLEEQDRTNRKKQSELFDHIDHWLEDFEELALLELRK